MTFNRLALIGCGLMGGSFAPVTDAREFVQNPRREFNLRFDPEAARAAMRTHLSNSRERLRKTQTSEAPKTI